jgi:hypothetical protein
MTSNIRGLNCVTKHNCLSERRLKRKLSLSATLQTILHHSMSIICTFSTFSLFMNLKSPDRAKLVADVFLEQLCTVGTV